MTARTAIDLTNQVALVTGGGDGLGRAFALALAKAGAVVAVTGRRAEPLAETVVMIERSGGRALAIPTDVTSADEVTRAVQTVEATLGPIDILVNNAGIVGPVDVDWRTDADDWWRPFEVNVLGSFRCAREVLPGMIERRRGRIVNVSSPAAFTTYPFMAAYGASKAAITQWTKRLAAETRAYGVAVFAFNPGAVRTPMFASLLESPVVGQMFQDTLDQGRDTPIERVAEKLLFLVSGRADALSGRFIGIQDNEDDLLRRVEEIQRNDLYTVTLRK
jgi:NAD(P)-dependent dehydrogenase (short-subunit alcohol dehydrogenase family)